MEQTTLLIKSNTQIIPGIFEMHLEGNMEAISHPGQFANLSLPGLYLRRPISICDYSSTEMTLLYKVVGKGTSMMAKMQKGEKLEVLNALGNGFNTRISYQRILLAGGGIGIAPLYKLAKELVKSHKKVDVALCFNTSSEVFFQKKFEELGIDVHLVTVDGSSGTKGFITDFLQQADIPFEYFYACGPLPMLKALSQTTTFPGEVSLEARMGCGFGICMGCSIQTIQGNKRVCKEGPVFRKEEILW